MNDKLKECPFCGSTKVYRSYDAEMNQTCIRCEHCDARGGYRKTAEEADEQWNHRAKMTVEEYERLQWLDKPMWPSWDV